MTLLRAMDPQVRHGRRHPPGVLRDRRARRSSTAAASAKIEGKIAVGDVVYPAGSDRAGEIIVEAGQKITKNAGRDDLPLAALTKVEVIETPKDAAASSTAWPRTPRSSHEEALLRIYQRLRPGNPPQLEKATDAVPREVLRHQPLSPGPRRPLPHQPQVRSSGRSRRRNDAAAPRT